MSDLIKAVERARALLLPATWAEYLDDHIDHENRDNPFTFRDLATILAALDRPAGEGEVERVARGIAAEHGLDPDATSPKAALAGHVIPEWMFFCRMDHDRLAAPSLSKDD